MSPENIVVQWHHRVTYIWVNIGSGNGVLPDGTKPLPEPFLTYTSRGIIIRGSEDDNQLNKTENCILKPHLDFPGANELNNSVCLILPVNGSLNQTRVPSHSQWFSWW